MFFLQELSHRENELDGENNISTIKQFEWRIPYGLFDGNSIDP